MQRCWNARGHVMSVLLWLNATKRHAARAHARAVATVAPAVERPVAEETIIAVSSEFKLVHA